MITVFPPTVREDATALVIFTGAPDRTVDWALVGSGVLTPLRTYTDANGSAVARYTPGTAGDTVTIQVTSGA